MKAIGNGKGHGMKRSVRAVAEKYKCPYCGKEFDHLLVYCIHIIEKHKEKERDSRGRTVFQD